MKEDQVGPVKIEIKTWLQGTTPDSLIKVWDTKTEYIHPEHVTPKGNERTKP